MTNARTVTTLELLNKPMREWCATSDALPKANVQEIESEAAALATKAARLSAYLSRLMSGSGHEGAVKRQNQVARKVRRALGFSYPDNAITF